MDEKKIQHAWELLLNMAQELEQSDCYMHSMALHYVAGIIEDGIHLGDTPASPPQVKSWEEIKQ